MVEPLDLGVRRLLWPSAFVVSLVATVASLNFSGIGPTGWRGMGLFPCELCWYQRILMYPLPVIIGIGLLRREARLHLYVLPLSVLGVVVAAYHVLLQFNPALEAGQCFVGSCTTADYLFLDVFSIPQMSLTAFVLITFFASVAAALRVDRREE